MKTRMRTNAHNHVDYSGPVARLLPSSFGGVKQTARPAGGLTVSGYTTARGAGTEYMVKIHGCPVWRRVYCLQFSNAASLFVNIDGGRVFVDHTDIAEALNK